MSERTTINVSKEAHRIAKQSKQEDESWSDYIQRCATDRDEELTREDLEDALNQMSMENEPGVVVDYGEIESRVERVLERMLR